jgi:xanthosine utilization system XapX-like protein
LPLALLDVSVTLPPAQNVVGPLGVIVGVAGIGLTVTFVAAEAALAQPEVVTTTVYVPAAVAM